MNKLVATVESDELDTSRRSSKSAGRPLAWRVLTAPQTRVGLVMVGIMVVVAALGPMMSSHSPTEIVGKPFALGDGGPLFGTDVLGRDVLSRVLWGGYSLLWMSAAATGMGVLLGTTIGLVASFYGGSIDKSLNLLLDIMLSFPTLILAILFISMFGPSVWGLVILLALGHTPGMARVMRGSASPVVSREHVMWARSIGLSTRYILTHEILRNVTSPLVVEIGLRLMWSVAGLASLSFLGFGLQPPKADWGLMVSENRHGLGINPWAVILPALCIAVFTMGASLFAEGVGRVVGRTEGAR